MKLLELRNSFLKGNFLPFSGPLFWWLHKNVTETVCISILLISRLSNSPKMKLTGSTRCPDSKIEKHYRKKIHTEPENGRIETLFLTISQKGISTNQKQTYWKKKQAHTYFSNTGKTRSTFRTLKNVILILKKRVRRLRVKPDGILAPFYFRCGQETQ